MPYEKKAHVSFYVRRKFYTLKKKIQNNYDLKRIFKDNSKMKILHRFISE